jgi:hypothetical protein
LGSFPDPGAEGIVDSIDPGRSRGPVEQDGQLVPRPPGGLTKPPSESRPRDAMSQAEASSALQNMAPLDSFLAKQAGGQPLFDRLAEWAKPYTPPPPPAPPPAEVGGPPPAATGELTGGNMGGAPASQADADAIRKRNEERDRRRRAGEF